MEDYNEFKPICSSSARFYVGISKIYNFTTMNFVQLFLKAADSDNVSRKICIGNHLKCNICDNCSRFVFFLLFHKNKIKGTIHKSLTQSKMISFSPYLACVFKKKVVNIIFFVAATF